MKIGNYTILKRKKQPFDSDLKIDLIKIHKEFTESQPCPKCHEKKLTLQVLEEGKTGWELAFKCGSCATRGVLNDSGFKVDFTKTAETTT